MSHPAIPQLMDELAALRAENERLREALATMTKNRDAKWSKLVAATDELARLREALVWADARPEACEHCGKMDDYAAQREWAEQQPSHYDATFAAARAALEGK